MTQKTNLFLDKKEKFVNSFVDTFTHLHDQKDQPFLFLLGSLTRPPPSEGPSPDRMEKVAFMSLARICKDPACLGTRLLDEATQIAHSESSTTRPGKNYESIVGIKY